MICQKDYYNLFNFNNKKLWESKQDQKKLLNQQESQTDVREIIKRLLAILLLLNPTYIKREIKRLRREKQNGQNVLNRQK